jgi:plasminogen activator
MHRNAVAALLAALLVAGTGASSALGEEATPSKAGISTELSLGVMRGEANEYVYNPDGSKLSQLIWTYDNVLALNGGIAWTPHQLVTVGARGQISLDNNSTMNDWDWGVVGCPGPNQICHSNHPDTRLKHAHSLDLYLAGNLIQHEGFALSPLIGYKWDYAIWKAYSGTANYAALPEGLGITYQQWWRAPYVGLALQQELGSWTVSGRVIGSWWVDANDEDNHHLRSLLFTDEFGRSRMIGVNAAVGYRLTDQISVNLKYDFQDWLTTQGPTTIADYANNTVSYIGGDAAGASNLSHTVSLGFKIDF